MKIVSILGIAGALFLPVDLKEELYPDISPGVVGLYADLDDAMHICVQFKFITIPPAVKQEFEINRERLLFAILNASRQQNIDYDVIRDDKERTKSYKDRWEYFTYLTDSRYLAPQKINDEERATRLTQVRGWCDGENIKLRKMIDGYIQFKAKEK